VFYGDEAAMAAQARELAGDPGVACFDTMDEAIMGLAATWGYRQFLDRPAPGDFTLPQPAASRPVRLPSEGLLVGEEAFAALKAYDFPLVPGVLAADEAGAAAAAAEMGYPVVLKIISAAWLHKSDWGGVLLNVANEAKLRQAFKDMLARFRHRTPDGVLDGILVQKQVKGVELLCGLKRDPQFGPVLVAGAGGIYTEVLQDVARALAPVSLEQAGRMLQALKISPILKGARGRKGVNLAALADTLVKLSRLATDYPRIRELDLNPVVATPEACWCVDCRIVLGE